jgi:ribosome silencing factor RsfS/YbeB/iojap
MPLRRTQSRPSTAASSRKAKSAEEAKALGKSASAAPRARTKKAKQAARSTVLDAVRRALDDLKAVNVTVLDVRELTDITDTMVVASGTSDRHVRSLAERVIEYAKKAGYRPAGVEGEREGEWVLVDLQDVIVHIMLPRVREFYRLENLWDVRSARRAATNERVADAGD